MSKNTPRPKRRCATCREKLYRWTTTVRVTRERPGVHRLERVCKSCAGETKVAA